MNPQYSCRIRIGEFLLMNCMKDRSSRNENPSLLFTMLPVYLQSLASYPW